MDLFLANVITVFFFVSAYLLVKKYRLIRQRTSYLSAFSVAAGLAVALLLVSFCFALILGAALPDIYVKTFAYKAVFVWLILAINWFWQMVKQQSGSNYA
jgi:multisubunit Na+/H+ antiporter MnhE subunit